MSASARAHVYPCDYLIFSPVNKRYLVNIQRDNVKPVRGEQKKKQVTIFRRTSMHAKFNFNTVVMFSTQKPVTVDRSGRFTALIYVGYYILLCAFFSLVNILT